MKVFINGELKSADSACVSVFDHGLLYGDGVFEGIRVYGGKAFKLKAHLKRLYDSAKAILLDVHMDEDALESAVIYTISENRMKDGYLRLILTRGQGPLGLDPSSCKTPTVIIIAAPLKLYPDEYYKNGIAIVTASSRRLPSDVLDPRVKSLNYLNNIMAKIEAAEAGCLEAVMLNKEGYVTECTADNIFTSKNGVLSSPPPSYGALDGITMQTAIELAEDRGINCRFVPLTRYDLYTADECLMTGTGAEIVPVIRIDGRTIGKGVPGPVTQMLSAAFRDMVLS